MIGVNGDTVVAIQVGIQVNVVDIAALDQHLLFENRIVTIGHRGAANELMAKWVDDWGVPYDPEAMEAQRNLQAEVGEQGCSCFAPARWKGCLKGLKQWLEKKE